MRTLEQRVRQRAWFYLEPGVAAVAGMTIFQLQQFLAGTYHPNETQLTALARRMQVPL